MVLLHDSSEIFNWANFQNGPSKDFPDRRNFLQGVQELNELGVSALSDLIRVFDVLLQLVQGDLFRIVEDLDVGLVPLDHFLLVRLEVDVFL